MNTGWGDSSREQCLVKIGRILKETIVRVDATDSASLLVGLSTYVGCTLDQPIEPQEEAKEDIATQEDKNIAESIGQTILELYRQVIKFEKDRIEITGKNKEEQEYMKRKIVMADDDIKFREK